MLLSIVGNWRVEEGLAYIIDFDKGGHNVRACKVNLVVGHGQSWHIVHIYQPQSLCHWLEAKL